MLKFSDFASERIPFEGDKISIDDVLDKEIIVHDYRICNSKFKNELRVDIQIEYDGKKRVIFTGSRVLREQLERYRDKLPFQAKIRFHQKFYSFG